MPVSACMQHAERQDGPDGPGDDGRDSWLQERVIKLQRERESEREGNNTRTGSRSLLTS